MSAGTSEFFCLICLLVCSCTAQKNITAEPGQDVILPCKASNINNINDITAVEWIRPGLDPEYILLYRDGNLDPDNQHPSYQNRVDLQDKEMKDGDFYLILKNVTMEDNGKYVCRVSQKGKTEPFSNIYLEVYLSALTNITAKHGQDVILPCKASNINNISDITAAEWIRPGLDPEYVLLYRNGSFDPHNQHPSYQNRVDLQDKEMKDGDFSLILKNVTMEDTGKYVCRVSQKGKTEPFSNIYREVYLSAQKKITAERGQDVVLPCKVPNVNNISDITAGGWRRPGLDPEYVLLYRNRSLNPDNRHESYQNRVVLQDKEMKDGDFSLILKKVKMEDTGTYECHVDQSGKNDLISIINLEVHPPAQEIITAERGQDVILPCKAPNINNISDITAVEWRRPGLDPEYILLYRDGRFNPDSQHPSYQNRVDLQDKEMKDGDFSLILKNVTMEDTGTYVCRVSQKGKTEPFSIIYLEVYLSDHSWIIGLAVGLPLGVLVCLLSAAAVYLYRQYRKRKTLENEKPEELEHLERNHSETKNQLQKEKQKIETLNSRLEEWMEMRRNLQNSIQNMNKELDQMNFDTISNFTGSDEENQQQKLEKQKWKKTVVNLKKELRNMDQELDKVISDPTGSFKENPQEEDENQKLVETVVNLKTELQNMNQKLELEESIAVADVHERGDVICPQNKSSEEIELEGCRLELQRNNREPVIYTFKE